MNHFSHINKFLFRKETALSSVKELCVIKLVWSIDCVRRIPLDFIKLKHLLPSPVYIKLHAYALWHVRFGLPVRNFRSYLQFSHTSSKWKLICMKGKAISLQKRGEIMLRQRKSVDSQKGWHNVVNNVTLMRCHNVVTTLNKSSPRDCKVSQAAYPMYISCTFKMRFFSFSIGGPNFDPGRSWKL